MATQATHYGLLKQGASHALLVALGFSLPELLLAQSSTTSASPFLYRYYSATGTKIDRKTPVQITTGVAYVNSGEFQTIFIKKDGTFWAMGDNGGGTLLGDGSNTDKPTPIKMAVTGIADLP